MTRSPNAFRRVSIVIPAFNAVDTIRETIESASAQTHKDIEIIVVDDGSTDGTIEVVQSLGEDIKLIRQPNLGPAAATNVGVSVSTGEWLAFLDADDLWSPEKLEAQLTRAEKSGANLVYTNVIPIGASQGLASLQHEPDQMPQGHVFAALLQDNFITLSSALMRHSVFESLGGFNESLLGAEDWDLWLRYADSEEVVTGCPEPLVRYRWGEGGVSANVLLMHRARLEVLRLHACATNPKLTASDVTSAFASAYACSAWAARRKRMLLHYLRFSLTARRLSIQSMFAGGKKSASPAASSTLSNSMSLKQAHGAGMITSICRKTVTALEESVRAGYYPPSDRAYTAPVVAALLLLAARYEQVPDADQGIRILQSSLDQAIQEYPSLGRYLDEQLTGAQELQALLNATAASEVST